LTPSGGLVAAASVSRKEDEMSKLTAYLVKRRHEGDRVYEEGETREAVEVEVRHLVPHVLEPVPAKGLGAAPRNKAESAAPANKAAKSKD
jgi:hypothetical protein